MGLIPVQRLTGIAGTDLGTARWHAVKLDATGAIVVSGAGDNAVGILEDAEAQGIAVSVMVLGECFAMYGGAVTPGGNLASDANGCLVPAIGTAAVVAVAREAGTAGEIHSVILITKTSSGSNTKAVLSIPVDLTAITGNIDVLTNFNPGYPAAIKKVDFLMKVPVTVAGKAATLTPYIGATPVTGGMVALTSAIATPLGKVIPGAAVTGANVLGAADTISIKATGVTAFTEGSGVLLITLG